MKCSILHINIYRNGRSLERVCADGATRPADYFELKTMRPSRLGKSRPLPLNRLRSLG